MKIKLNKPGYDHALSLINGDFEIEHDSNNWDEVKPTRDDEARYLNTHTLEEYGIWFLGIDLSEGPDSKDKYVYPFGDFSVVHRSGLVAAEKRANKENNQEIKEAIKNLLLLIDKKC